MKNNYSQRRDENWSSSSGGLTREGRKRVKRMWQAMESGYDPRRLGPECLLVGPDTGSSYVELHSVGHRRTER